MVELLHTHVWKVPFSEVVKTANIIGMEERRDMTHMGGFPQALFHPLEEPNCAYIVDVSMN